jgi:hypothetical protein
MSESELQTFCDSELQAVLSSLRRDGSPFAIPLGFIFTGETFFVTGGVGRALAPRVRRDPRVCLTVMSEQPYPTKFVIAEGHAVETADPDDRISRSIFDRGEAMHGVVGLDRERFFQSWIAVGRVVFEIRVTNLITYDGTKTPRSEKYSTGTGMPGDRRHEGRQDR